MNKNVNGRISFLFIWQIILFGIFISIQNVILILKYSFFLVFKKIWNNFNLKHFLTIFGFFNKSLAIIYIFLFLDNLYFLNWFYTKNKKNTHFVLYNVTSLFFKMKFSTFVCINMFLFFKILILQILNFLSIFKMI